MCHMTVPAIKPVTEIKRRATEILSQLQADRVPVLITEHGRSAAVLLDVESYQDLLRRLEILEGIARGERAFSEGRVVTHREAKKRLGRWLDERINIPLEGVVLWLETGEGDPCASVEPA